MDDALDVETVALANYSVKTPPDADMVARYESQLSALLERYQGWCREDAEFEGFRPGYVSAVGARFQARVKEDGKLRSLGLYDTREDASEALYDYQRGDWVRVDGRVGKDKTGEKHPIERALTAESAPCEGCPFATRCADARLACGDFAAYIDAKYLSEPTIAAAVYNVGADVPRADIFATLFLTV